METDNQEFTRKASFEEYRLLLLNELDRISRDVRSLNEKVDLFRREDVAQMRTDIAVLKFQAALYGAIAGLMATGAISLAVKLLRM